jgi:hypothetical protein
VEQRQLPATAQTFTLRRHSQGHAEQHWWNKRCTSMCEQRRYTVAVHVGGAASSPDRHARKGGDERRGGLAMAVTVTAAATGGLYTWGVAACKRLSYQRGGQLCCPPPLAPLIRHQLGIRTPPPHPYMLSRTQRPRADSKGPTSWICPARATRSTASAGSAAGWRRRPQKKSARAAARWCRRGRPAPQPRTGPPPP